ncbi:MAG TPA: Ig-like domain-containing protein [Streptosporangiaceae bacterium]|nr:Ig-like domain-containing protein [Streptosporangiaceae bacterium]
MERVEDSVLRKDSPSWRTRSLPFVVVCAAGVLAAACQSASSTTGSGKGGISGSVVKATVQVLITPAAGSKDVNPASGITVTAARGVLRTVSVSGGQVSGTLNAARTVWHSNWTLPVAKALTVTATAADQAGHVVTRTSTFRTLTPAQSFTTMIFEGYQQTYGVGMPIILEFSRPITNRAAVERSLVVTTSKPVVGAWYWDTSQTLVFRTRDYWPTNTSVSFVGHLNGVQGAPGVYGTHLLTQQFRIGGSLIVVASTSTHRMKLYRGGRLIRNWPISSGRPGDDTPDGTYLTIEKANPTLMKGPGYSIEVPWSVRFTWTGDYLHDAYWSVGQQGFTNVSHGCVNMAPADAQFYYQMAVPGDPVTITGSPKGGTWDNGWTYWFLTWAQFLKGSALHQAVLAGPHGSAFVSPDTLAASAASAPLGKPWPENSRVG